MSADRQIGSCPIVRDRLPGLIGEVEPSGAR